MMCIRIRRFCFRFSIILSVLLFSAGTEQSWAGPRKAALTGTARTQLERIKTAELSQMVVFLQEGSDPAQFAVDHGLTFVRAMASMPNAYVFDTTSTLAAQFSQEEKRSRIKSDGRTRQAYVNHRARLVRYAFTPNDPYFHHNTPASGWDGEWHLINELGKGVDVQVQGVWNNNYTGQGVTIGIVDDSLQKNHPDLSPHYDSTDSWNFGTNTADPSPVSLADTHGTMVAGVAAAAGGNSIGICGAAPKASLAGLRLDFNTNPSSEADVADADMYHSSGLNTSIKIKNHSYGYAEPWLDLPLEKTALATSANAGTIHVFAAGNGRDPRDWYVTADANKAMYQNSPNVISVAALDKNGIVEYYSSFGSCIFVAAPSGLLTTDRTSSSGENSGGTGNFPDANYIDEVAGTSFSSPLAAGVLALIKQAQPALDVRFAKHLLARCSDQVNAEDSSTESGGGWRTNAAGLKFNENYGFGLINATRLLAMARRYKAVSALKTENTGTITSGRSIPDNNTTGITVNFSLQSTTPLEEMQVTVNITHSYIGDLEIWLTSPQGTTSRLITRDDQDNTQNLNWTLLSNAFWGENPAGKWSLKIKDISLNDTGTLKSFSATARMGYLISSSSAMFIDYP